MKIPKLFQQYGLLVLGALAVIIFGIQLRLYPLTHLVNTEHEHRATLLVVNQMQQDIASDVQAMHPTLSPQEKNNLAKQELSNALRNDSRNLWKSIEAKTQELAKSTPLKTTPYLLASDSYYFLWLTKNVLEFGDISASIKNGQFFGDKMAAPLGQWEPFTAHPYIGAWIYKTIALIKPNVELMTAVGFTPLFIFAFIMIVFFIFARRINLPTISIVTSAFFFSYAHIFLRRSTYGWYDSDPYNVFFPLIIFLFFYLANTSPRAKLYSILCGLSCAGFSLFWQGWLFIFPIMISTIVLYLGVAWVRHKKINTSILINNGILLASCLVFLLLFHGVGYFHFYITHLIDGIMRLTSTNTSSLWPDLFTGIGELKRISLLEIVNLCGGLIAFIIALCGFAKLIIKSITSSKNQQTIFLAIMLSIWIIIATLLSIKAQRFAILMLPPLMLFLGIGITVLSKKIQQFLPRPIGYVTLILPLALIIIPTSSAHTSIRNLLNPIFNSTWDRALTHIKNNTPDNSIVTSWWTPGHFIKAIAERSTTFDGASIKSPQGYWISKILLSNDEAHALGMLRMLNNSSNESIDYLTEIHGWPLSKSIAFIQHLTTLTPNDALVLVSSLFTPLDASKLLSFTHATPPPSYLLIYHEMIDDPVLLSIFDKWDFSNAEASLAENQSNTSRSVNNNKTMNYTLDSTDGSYRYSDIKPLAKETDTLLAFSDNIVIKKESKNVLINSKTYGKGIPKSLIYLDNGRVIEKTFSNATLSYSIVLSKNRRGKWQTVLMDQQLANSILVKLYYFDAAGLNYLSLFNAEHDYTDKTRIKTFAVDWEKFFIAEARHAGALE